jgi:catechol 2,3-dioxygenase-like lactoylglutathione lyase family enzyme
MTNISHIEINVREYAKSIRFYDSILTPLGWKRLVCTESHTTYSDGTMKFIICPAEDKYRTQDYHRKNVGLNHLAFNVKSKSEVDEFYQNILVKNNIDSLYHQGADGDDEYYAVYFEDPDRIKLEVVYAPNYLKEGCWPNNLENDFDPYGQQD